MFLVFLAVPGCTQPARSLLGPANRTAGTLQLALRLLGKPLNALGAVIHCLILLREYAPGEFKLMTSNDGGNFEEAACWQKPNTQDASLVEFVMFDTPQTVKSLSIAMRSPMSWRYFGIADVTLIVEPYAFMVISGAMSSSGELCLVAKGAGLGTEPCLKAVAAGDGREIFSFKSGQLVAAGSSKCMTLVNGDVSKGGKLALETCTSAADADDGRSSWTVTSAGHMKMANLGDYCLVISEQGPSVHECADESVTGGDRFTLAAVPEFNGRASIASKSSASLLKAATARQSSLLAKLQEAIALLRACTLPTSLANSNRTSALRALPKLGSHPVLVTSRATDAAMAAIEQIYAANGVDMTSVQQLIADTAATLKGAGEKLGR